MIGEHEIPAGSNLYFGKSAKLKRELETRACQLLASNEFEEIVTPYFTFENHSRNESECTSSTIRLSDKDNNNLTLRQDSSLDVIRLITKRLGRSTKHKKWFYVQPVFEFPSKEINQIGAEFMDCTSETDMISLATNVLESVELEYTLQLSNSLIPTLAAELTGVDFELFRSKNITKLKAVGADWLNALIAIESIPDLKTSIDSMPHKIAVELDRLLECAQSLNSQNIKIDPLYVSSLGYYSGIFFRVFNGNQIYIKGGAYEANNKNNFGFAIYSDNVIKQLETEK